MDKYYLVTGDGAPYVLQYGRGEAVSVWGAFDVAKMEDGYPIRRAGVETRDMHACTIRYAALALT